MFQWQMEESFPHRPPTPLPPSRPPLFHPFASPSQPRPLNVFRGVTDYMLPVGIQMEDALFRHGSSKEALPYWDWTFPMEKPARLLHQRDLLRRLGRDEVLDNPFARGLHQQRQRLHRQGTPQPELPSSCPRTANTPCSWRRSFWL